MTTPPEARGPRPPGTDGDPIAWYGRARPVFSGGNTVGLLRGGDQLFPAMLEAIAAARHEVWLVTYIFELDASGARVRDALCEAARRGVRVHVVVDGFGGGGGLDTLIARLRDEGVDALAFRPLRGWWSWFSPGQLRRMHQKLCVVDGRRAFVGGINLIDDRHDLRHGWSEAPRLDYALSLQGPVVRPVQHTCQAVFTRARSGRDWREEIAAVLRDPEPLLRARRFLRRLRQRAGAPALGGRLLPVRAAFVVRDNLRQRRTIERAYIEAIRGARARIDIVSPYFYPARAFRVALREAARRGVRVRLLMQGRWDYRFAELAARAVYDELLGHGIEIHEYQPAFLHAKVAVVDEDWATVGSSNIDPLSLLLNLEANVIVRDAPLAGALRAELDEAFAASRQVPRDTRHLGWARRVLVAWAARVYLRIAGLTGSY